MLSYFLAVLTGAAVLVADQLTKYLVATNFALGESRTFLKGFLDLTYIQNRGGAWGMLSGKTYLLLVVTVLVMALCVVFYVKYGKKNKLLLWAITLVLSGGVGNMLDRVFNGGGVVDFLHFSFFPSFPVFNIADCAIVLGAGLLMLYFISDGIRESKKPGNADPAERQDGEN